jgi:hypothetical protein
MAEEGFYLSAKTYGELERVISERDGEAGGGISASGTRQVVHILITSACADSQGHYDCTPTAFNGSTWDTYTDSITITKCLHPNGQGLVNGDRYLAVRYGVRADGATLFVTERGGGYGTACSSSSSSGSSGTSSGSSGISSGVSSGVSSGTSSATSSGSSGVSSGGSSGTSSGTSSGGSSGTSSGGSSVSSVGSSSSSKPSSSSSVSGGSSGTSSGGSSVSSVGSSSSSKPSSSSTVSGGSSVSSSSVSGSSTSSSSSGSLGPCTDSICVVTDVSCYNGQILVTKKCYKINNGQFCEVLS